MRLDLGPMVHVGAMDKDRLHLEPTVCAGGALHEAALLLGPHTTIETIPSRVIGALATRFNKSGKFVKRDILKDADITEWTKIQRVDSEAGDTMVASMSPSSALSNREDLRNPTFVRYEMLIDIHANKPRAPPQFVPQTFYGQLQRIYFICLKNAAPIPNYGIPAGHSIIMVEILPVQGYGHRRDWTSRSIAKWEQDQTLLMRPLCSASWGVSLMVQVGGALLIEAVP
ncbi:hypothetical protein MVEN_02597100 [Mycena venus]|uniref:Uncharacterized protein n=1 Tax=Mycena venus TaxID=2733690 RepID=A0A8H6U1A6_9AGAR|nr:hypothetical protein MVEN_02597100 [Mycena venus]